MIAGYYGINAGAAKFNALTGTGKIAAQDVLLLFPQTYMNNSGAAVGAALQYYRESAENLVVVHDEIELPFGEIRAKFGGGHKGNNGIRSIIEHAGTPDFHRIRSASAGPPRETPVADYLLSNFSSEEYARLKELFPAVIEQLEKIIAA
jgi:PTH1 family peptidyl-tRNA hydrolase